MKVYIYIEIYIDTDICALEFRFKFRFVEFIWFGCRRAINKDLPQLNEYKNHPL